MEKIFYPNKWFILFCGLLIVIWLALQLVMNLRIANEAKLIGQHIFTWSWTGKHWQSIAQITKADIVHRYKTDAIVKIQGRQVLTELDNKLNDSNKKSQVVDCSATLTFYRLNNNWILSKVEFP